MRQPSSSALAQPSPETTAPAGAMPEIDAAIEVRRHPGARRMTLRVSRTRRAVIVTLPAQCDLGEAGPFLERNLDWVRERLGRLPDPVPFRDGVVVPLRGQAHRLAFIGSAKGRAPVARRLTPDPITGPAPSPQAGSLPALEVAGRTEHAARRLNDWLFDEARADLRARVDVHAAFLGLKPKRVAVRDQTSRWGSCSTTGVLSFSWRLILAPPLVLDYVSAHEVAHLAEMNHGARFWGLVKAAVPRIGEARDWLRVYGLDLHRYGATSGD